MACEVKISNEAEHDLDSALHYLAVSLGTPVAASTLLDSFDAVVSNITAFPGMYPISSEPRLARLGYRKATMGSYLLLYRVQDDIVIVARIFHHSMDYARLV